MRKLVDVTVRAGIKPGDGKKAADLIEAGRAVIGDPGAAVGYYRGKAPPPPDDRWFYLVESRKGVVGYAAVSLGRSERIPSNHVVAMSIPAGLPAETAHELTVLMLRWSCALFFDTTQGAGYVTVDVPEEDIEVRSALDAVGLEHIATRKTRKTGKGGIARYAALPCHCPAHAPPADGDDE